MKWLVCGSRSLSIEAVARMVDKLDDLRIEFGWPDEVIEGGARGADVTAAAWAVSRDIPVSEFKAEWNRYGRSAGPRRNEVMLAESPDWVFAFVDKPLAESRGTAHMVRIAREAGVNVRVFRARVNEEAAA